MAGLIGLLLVAIFMILWYPCLDFVSDCGWYLCWYFLCYFLWPITLTLAGIAGFILSIGMAVDALCLF